MAAMISSYKTSKNLFDREELFVQLLSTVVVVSDFLFIRFVVRDARTEFCMVISRVRRSFLLFWGNQHQHSFDYNPIGRFWLPWTTVFVGICKTIQMAISVPICKTIQTNILIRSIHILPSRAIYR